LGNAWDERLAAALRKRNRARTEEASGGSGGSGGMVGERDSNQKSLHGGGSGRGLKRDGAGAVIIRSMAEEKICFRRRKVERRS